MTVQISISISPGKSQTFSGEDEPTFDKARAWLKEQHVPVAKAGRERRAKEHAERQAKIAEEARTTGAPAKALTPDTVKAKGGSN